MGATWRGFFIGIIFCGIAALMAHYSINIVHGSYMAIDHMPMAGIFLFFLIVGVLNVLLALIRKPLQLTSAELLQIYIMLLLACSVTTMGLGSQFLPIISAPHYYASPENRWGELILPHLNKWLFVQDKEAVRSFFEGLPKDTPLPLKPWLTPILAWSPFLLSLFVVMICIPVILSKQWIERERLIFPLVHLPLEMVKKESPDSLFTSFYKNKLMWLGFFIPVFISSLDSILHYYLKIMPSISLVKDVPAFRRTRSIHFRLSFPVLGFIYLTNLNVSFSLWFFSLLFQIVSGIFNITGVASIENLGIYGTRDVIFNHVGIGAITIYALYGLWIARSHLKEVFRKALKGGEEEGGIISYRTAFWGAVIGSIVMICWLVFAGIPLFPALFYFFLAFAIYLGVTRVVIEGGVPTLVASGIATPQTISSLGTSVIGTKGLANMALTYVYSADIRTYVMSAASNSLKIVYEGIKRNRRLIFLSMLVAVIASFTTSILIDFYLAYRYGGINLNSWYFVGGPQAPYRFLADKILHPTPPNLTGWIAKLTGGGIMFLLMFMRERFIWWPLHPIGFAIGSVWLMDKLWFSIFLAWMLKSLILRYGGPTIYFRSRPFFLGLILGQYFAAGLWFVIDLITGVTEHVVFWI